MNTEFVKKMLQAKLMEYEAVKEIMPLELRNRVEKIEDNAIQFAKDLAFEMFLHSKMEHRDIKEENNEEHEEAECPEAPQKRKAARTAKRTVQKVKVDFMEGKD